MGRAGNPSSHWSVRYRDPIATVRTGAVVTVTVLLTAALEVAVMTTAAPRARDGDLVDASLNTVGLAALPLAGGALAALLLRRSVWRYRQLFTETCCWVLGLDLIVLVALLRGQ